MTHTVAACDLAHGFAAIAALERLAPLMRGERGGNVPPSIRATRLSGTPRCAPEEALIALTSERSPDTHCLRSANRATRDGIVALRVARHLLAQQRQGRTNLEPGSASNARRCLVLGLTRPMAHTPARTLGTSACRFSRFGCPPPAGRSCREAAKSGPSAHGPRWLLTAAIPCRQTAELPRPGTAPLALPGSECRHRR